MDLIGIILIAAGSVWALFTFFLVMAFAEDM